MDGAGLGSCDHCIIDHCSISWSSDEGTSSRGAHNITFQRNIVAEALHHGPHYRANDRTKLETHAFAGSISGDIGSYHHNLLADCTDRNWSLAGGLNQGGHYAGYLDIRNNVVYNWTARTTDGGVSGIELRQQLLQAVSEKSVREMAAETGSDQSGLGHGKLLHDRQCA